MPRARSFLLAAATAVPLAALIANLVRCGLPFPFWDSWLLVPLLEADRQGRLALADLWQLHNGHRLLFPRLLMLALARASDWDVRWELATNLLLAVLCCGLLVWLAARDEATWRARWWLLPALSTLVFSWAQMENWIWGWQLQAFLSTAAAVAGLAVLSRRPLGRLGFVAAIALGAVASTSFAAGLVYWLAAGPLLAGPLARRDRSGWTRIVVWAGAASAVTTLYLAGTGGGDGPGAEVAAALRTPIAFARHLLVSLGSPVSGLFLAGTQMNTAGPDERSQLVAATALGLLGLAAAVVLVVAGLRRRLPWASLAPWLALCLLGAGAAVLTSLGRSNVGLSQALASRYTTVITPFWCGLLGLAATLRPARLQQRDEPRAATAVAVLCLVIVLQVVEVRANRFWERFVEWRRLAILSLRVGNSSPVFANQLYFNGEDLVATYVPIVLRNRLAGFGAAPAVSPKTIDLLVAHAADALADGRPAVAQAYLRTALTVAPEHPGAQALVAREHRAER